VGCLILKKKGMAVLGLISILLAVVMVSGCTSSGNSTSTNTPQKDLYVVGGELSVTHNKAGTDEWLVTGNIEPRSKTKYSDAIIQFNAMDAQNNTIGSKTLTLNFNQNTNGAYVQIIIIAPGAVDHVSMNVLNATKL